LPSPLLGPLLVAVAEFAPRIATITETRHLTIALHREREREREREGGKTKTKSKPKEISCINLEEWKFV